jgi:hypothetical protein
MEDNQLRPPSLPPEADAPSATPQQQPAERSLGTEQIKAWGDAAAAMLKAVLLTLAILAVGIVIGTTVWRDQHSHVVTIVVDPEAEKTLRVLGSDLDLHKALIDALKERETGAKQIVAQVFKGVIGDNQLDAVNFKSLGLDLSTGDIVHMSRDVLGSPREERVRVEFICPPLLCTPYGASQGPLPPQGSLLVTLSGDWGSRRDSYPIPLTNPGLRRGLHQAMQRSANLLIEKAAPIIASIYDLNAPFQAVFWDDKRQEWGRAEGEALTARTGKDNCVADLVIGVSMMWRGLIQKGIAAEKQAAAESADSTCQVHAGTNITFLLEQFALCHSLPTTRKEAYDLAWQAQDKLSKFTRSMVPDDQVYYRIPTGSLSLDIVKAITETPDDEVRKAFCEGARIAPPGVRNAMNKRIRDILDGMPSQLPPNQSYYAHGVFGMLRRALETGVPREDLHGRLMTAHKMMDVIDNYALTDKHPRWLFLEQGELAMDAALATHAVLGLPDAEKLSTFQAAGVDAVTAKAAPDAILQSEILKDLTAARVAFENAIATDTPAPLIEQSSDIEPLVRLGDALFAIGDIPGAKEEYARAVDAFIEDDEPLDQIILLARAATHWASLRVASGGCRPNAVPDAAWEKRWGQLGAGAHDVCVLDQPEGEADRASMFGIIRPLVADATKRCAQPTPAPERGGPKDWRPQMKERLAMLDCLRGSGPDDQSVLSHFINDQTGAAVEAEIENALSTRPDGKQ